METNLPKIIKGSNKPGTILTEMKIRSHTIICDEEPLYEGNDEAPDPYDYVLSGVIGCTAISLRTFARNKGWDIGEISIKLTYDRINEEGIVTGSPLRY